MSGNAARHEEFMTLAQFRAADFDRYTELLDGVPVAHAQPSFRHGRLIGSLGEAVRVAIRRAELPCHLESGGSALEIEASSHGLERDHSLGPDLMVRCGGSFDRPGDPVLLVEVLSPSNRAGHLMKKLRAYRAVRSVTAILLVQQDEHLCHLHVRGEDGEWKAPVDIAGPDTLLEIERIQLRLPLRDLYEDVLPAD
jgi:Uma2 family endonuclease